MDDTALEILGILPNFQLVTRTVLTVDGISTKQYRMTTSRFIKFVDCTMLSSQKLFDNFFCSRSEKGVKNIIWRS